MHWALAPHSPATTAAAHSIVLVQAYLLRQLGVIRYVGYNLMLYSDVVPVLAIPKAGMRPNAAAEDAQGPEWHQVLIRL